MSQLKFANLMVTGLAAAALIACSGESPVAPGPGQDGGLDLQAKAIPGSYELSFFKFGSSGLEPVSSLPVSSEELILGAHVEDNAGLPAGSGAVSFQYCSYKGLPPNDITRADEAPSAACASGLATWDLLTTVPLDASGNAFMNFGIVQIPRTVGFRFKYLSRGSGIANGMSAPADFTWVAQ